MKEPVVPIMIRESVGMKRTMSFDVYCSVDCGDRPWKLIKQPDLVIFNESASQMVLIHSILVDPSSEIKYLLDQVEYLKNKLAISIERNEKLSNELKRKTSSFNVI